MAAQTGAHQSWANTEDRSARTTPARAALDAKFLTQAGGDPVRAAHYRKAYFCKLALKSAQSRRKSGELTSAAELAEAELAALGGGDGEPPGGLVAPSIRRSTSAEAVAQPRRSRELTEQAEAAETELAELTGDTA